MNYRLILTTKHGKVFVVEFKTFLEYMNWLNNNLSASYFVSFTLYNNEYVSGVVTNECEFK